MRTGVGGRAGGRLWPLAQQQVQARLLLRDDGSLLLRGCAQGLSQASTPPTAQRRMLVSLDRRCRES